MVERGHVHILDCGNGRRRKRLGSVRRGGERYAKAKSMEAKPVHLAIAGVPHVQGTIEPLFHGAILLGFGKIADRSRIAAAPVAKLILWTYSVLERPGAQ